MDPRHKLRIKIIENLYAYSYNNTKMSLPHPKEKKTIDVIKHIDALDKFITTFAPKYPVDKIAKTDLAILRLSIYELMIERHEPEKVIINEAVELAQEFSGKKSSGFINAVLGQIFKNSEEHKSYV